MNTRRSFMALLGMAPIAAPVVAQEATVSAGLVGLGSNVPAINSGWAKAQLENFWDPNEAASRERQADKNARLLDVDLASMRSLSPSAAYFINRDRCRTRAHKSGEEWLRNEISKATKGLLS